MGWLSDDLITSIGEVQLRRLIGEALDLGSVGLLVFLIYMNPAGPWWESPAVPASSSANGANDSLEEPASHAEAGQTAKRRRRTGCLKVPASRMTCD
jgi:hypothetical protein